MLIVADGDHVWRRLIEVRDWAAYIHEALTRDQSYELGKVQVLEKVVEGEVLGKAREEARSLLARLNGLLERLESPVEVGPGPSKVQGCRPS